MTEWCSSTTSVRKVRARSSDRLRALTFGAARTSAVAADDEIEVMRTPGRVIVSDVAVGNLIQQGPKSRFPGRFAERPLRPPIRGKLPRRCEGPRGEAIRAPFLS